MNILVTGANGFVGRVLCKKMLADGWQVRGTVRNSNQLNKLPTKVEGVLVGDIGPDTDWSKTLNGVDAVVHLAARVHMMNDTASRPAFAIQVGECGRDKASCTTGGCCQCKTLFFYEFCQGEWGKDQRHDGPVKGQGVRGRKVTERVFLERAIRMRLANGRRNRSYMKLPAKPGWK